MKCDFHVDLDITIILRYYICSKYCTLLCTGCGECGVSSGEKCHYISYYVRPSLDTRARNEPSQNLQCFSVLNSVLNVKLLVGAFKQEKALVGAFSVIAKTSP